MAKFPVTKSTLRGSILVILMLFVVSRTGMAQRSNGNEPTTAVTGFTLIDSQTDLPVPGYDPIPDGAILNLKELPKFLNVRANTTGPVGMVRFSYNDDPRFRLEKVAPYALFGDVNGDYLDAKLRRSREQGAQVLEATSFHFEGDRRRAGTTASISFTVVSEGPGFVVTQLTLVDADTDADLFVLEDGATLDLATLPTNLNVRADVRGPVESVRFNHDPQGNERVENVAPYALFGDASGNYYGGIFREGEHTLSAIAFRQPNAKGQHGLPYTIKLNVVNGANPSKMISGSEPAVLLSETTPESFSLDTAYPNPFNPATTIRFGLQESASVRLTVYDMLGREVRRLVDEFRAAGSHEVTFDAQGLPSGTYLYRLETPHGSEMKQMLLLK